MGCAADAGSSGSGSGSGTGVEATSASCKSEELPPAAALHLSSPHVVLKLECESAKITRVGAPCMVLQTGHTFCIRLRWPVSRGVLESRCQCMYVSLSIASSRLDHVLWELKNVLVCGAAAHRAAAGHGRRCSGIAVDSAAAQNLLQ